MTGQFLSQNSNEFDPKLSPRQVQDPPSLHQSDADEDDENVKQLNECASAYLSLQDCLVNSNRNWKSCQKEVQALKACNESRKSGETTTTKSYPTK